MKPVDSAARLKRFKVNPGHSVELIFETMTGQQFTTKIANASFRGVASVLKREDHERFAQSQLEAGDIVPESKVLWNQYECGLGRLSLVRIDHLEDESIRLAFSCIDAKIPLGGNLAGLFQEVARGNGSPLDFELSPNQFSIADFVEKEFQHPDLFERTKLYQILLKEHKKSPLFQYYSVRGPNDKARVKFRLAGTGATIDAVSFASYDYLGFSSEDEVKEAAIKAIEKYGVSPAGSLILSGKTELHEELEHRIAETLHKEDCLLFSNGFAANVGTLSGLLRANDLVVADISSHASVHDGIAASKARARFFRHNDLMSLRSLLEKHRSESNGTLLITEGVFSMEGTTPNLRSLVKLAHEFNARTFIDECHSIGVFGQNHLGLAEREGVLSEIDIFMSSFTKSLGAGACGFVCAKKEVIDWLRFFARAGMFSGAPSPHAVAASIKILSLMKDGDQTRFRKLKENVKRFRDGLQRIGLSTHADPESPIVPVIVADNKKLAEMNKILLEEGVYVNCILYPAVPMDAPRFRFSITCNHTASDIDLAINALKKAFVSVGAEIQSSLVTHEIAAGQAVKKS